MILERARTNRRGAGSHNKREKRLVDKAVSALPPPDDDTKPVIEPWSLLPAPHRELVMQQRALAEALAVFQNPLKPDDVHFILAAFRAVQLNAPRVKADSLADRRDLFENILLTDSNRNEITQKLGIAGYTNFIHNTVRNQLDTFRRGLGRLKDNGIDVKEIFERKKMETRLLELMKRRVNSGNG